MVGKNKFGRFKYLFYICIVTNNQTDMLPLREISYKNEFFYGNNTFTREIHTYSETDWVCLYRGHSIWKFVTNCRNDGSRAFDIVKDKRVVKTCDSTHTIEDVKKVIDNLIEN
jgi:hypothetical protein